MKIKRLATCIVLLAATSATAQVDFTSYVALGDNLTAGFGSGSLMDWYQERSYPAVLAHQGGAPVFEQPLVSEPGIPQILELVSLAPVTLILPVDLISPGFPTNAEYPAPYNNLGIPGATLYDMIFQTGDINNLIQGNFDTVFFDIVLRNGVNTALEQAIGLQPTFMTVWIGNSDVLSAVLSATPIDGVTMTPVAAFAELYQNALGALVTNTEAEIVLINLPDPTRIPFTTSISPLVEIPGIGPVPLTADTGPLSASDLVTFAAGALIAQGYGLPGGPPLPDDLNLLTGEPGYVLRAAEVEAISDRIDALNAVIDQVGDALGLPVLDINARFDDIASRRNLPEFGGIELTADFLIGGIFSYDGIHTQNIGSAFITHELIDFINITYGDSIPQVDMARVLYEGDWQDPGDAALKAGEVVMSDEAFDQLWEVFKPKLKRTPRMRRPGVASDPIAPNPRRKPNPLP
jgi:lysophospholipase L1-like esterase